MRVTQGQFSFLPELTDPEIKKQIELCPRQRLGASGDRIYRRPASAEHVLVDVGHSRCST